MTDAFGAPGRPAAFSFRTLRSFPQPSEERAWREFLARADLPSHYTGPEYFLEPYWARTPPFAVLVLQDNRVAGVLTGIHEGPELVSGNTCRPQTCFDPALDCAGAAHALARGLVAEAGSADLVTVYTWTPIGGLVDMGFRARALTGVVMLDLRQGVETLFKQLHAGRRRNIRHAIRQGVEVFEATREEDVTAYYEVYRRWRRTTRKTIPMGELVPPVFAEAYRLRDNRRLFLARHAGQIIAGVTVRFRRGGLLQNQESASLDEYLHLRPNDLLLWKTMEWGCAEGFSQYSLEGAHPFFLRTGGTVVPVYRHRLDRTWLRRHDLRETLESRTVTRAMLPLMRGVLRGGRALRRALTG